MKEATMKSRVVVPLLCLLVWGMVLACNDGMLPTAPVDGNVVSAGLVTPSLKTGGRSAYGFNGDASGFPTGAVRLTGGGSYDPSTASNIVPTETSVVSSGGFD